MAKQKKVSVHSRAARRATSPSIDLDKSLRSAKPPVLSSSTFQSSHHGGDSRVIKKSKGKQIKREKRVRLERAVHRAEAVMDQIEQKVERSKTKGRAMKNRKVAWEDINEKLPQKPASKTNHLSTQVGAGDGHLSHTRAEPARHTTIVDTNKSLGSSTESDRPEQSKDEEDVIM